MRGKEANDTDFPTDNSRPSERADANVAADRHAAQISCLLHACVCFSWRLRPPSRARSLIYKRCIQNLLILDIFTARPVSLSFCGAVTVCTSSMNSGQTSKFEL